MQEVLSGEVFFMICFFGKIAINTGKQAPNKIDLLEANTAKKAFLSICLKKVYSEDRPNRDSGEQHHHL